MKPKVILALFITTVVLVTLAAEQSRSTGVIHFTNDKVAATFAKGGMLLVTNNFKVMAGRRVAPGEVEIHDQDTDIFYIVEGTATFVTGGKAVDQKTTSPGETRAKEISGGQEQKLAKGEVIVIPKGVPHWFKAVDSTFLYYVVKVR